MPAVFPGKIDTVSPSRKNMDMAKEGVRIHIFNRQRTQRADEITPQWVPLQRPWNYLTTCAFGADIGKSVYIEWKREGQRNGEAKTTGLPR